MTVQLELEFQSAATIGDLSAAALLDYSRQLLCQLDCRRLAARLQIIWNSRMRSTAGSASSEKCRICLNPALRQFGALEVEVTLKHELAHLVAHERAGRRRIAPHGVEWKEACRDLGLENESRCHRLPLPRRELQRKFAYRCPACGLILQRVRRLRRPAACLACCKRHNRAEYDSRFRLVLVPGAVG